jgi:fermentation-respiration switch protein FrsA (DUF1100 family)
MPRPVIQDLLFFASSGKLKHPDTGENSLDKLKQKQLPPTLIVSGTQDRICPPFNVQILDTAVQSPLKEVHLVKDAGHVDLVTSSKMNEVIAVFNDFLGKIN